VTRHAKPIFVIVLVAGLVLAGTSALVRLGASDQGTQPKNQTARRAYDLLAEGFGPGFNGPIPIVVDVKGDERAPQRVYDGVRGLDDVASVAKPQFNKAKTVAIVFVTPNSAPQDEKTAKLVHRLRDDVVPAATKGSAAAVYVSGLNAAFIDIADRIMQRLPLFLLYIIGVTFIVLAMAFRSIVISLTGGDHDHPLGVHRVRCAHARDPGGPPDGSYRARPDRADRDLRAADRVRDPLRPVDGLHGLPREPHPGGARPRAEHEEAVEHGIAAIGRVIVAAA
jgi:predicted RND superfamily exporter protein